MKSLYFLYHELRHSSSDYTYALENLEFKRHCELFKARQLHVLEIRPEITFDDGHRSNYEVALPTLNQYELKARFFVTAGWVEERADYVNRSELLALHEAGHAIGAHGWSHALLTHCNRKQLELELVGARRSLEDSLGCAIKSMSLPGGRFNKRVLDTCWEAGYAEVFSSIPGAESPKRALRVVVGRLNVQGDVNVAWLKRVLDPRDSLLSELRRKEDLKQVARRILGDGLYQKLWAVMNNHEQREQVSETLQP